ncbi:hypothetical protein [Cognatishimia sp.]
MRKMIEKARIHIGSALIGLGVLIAPDSYFKALLKTIKEESI